MSITTSRGTPLADSLYGTLGRDWLVELGAADVLYGDGAPVGADGGAALVLAGGDDALAGGAGDDTLRARPRSPLPSGWR